MKKLAAIALTLSTYASTAEAALPQPRQTSFSPRISDMRDPVVATARETEPTLRPCIAPRGTTTSTLVDKTIGVPEVARAILHELGAWRYMPYAAPAPKTKLPAATPRR